MENDENLFKVKNLMKIAKEIYSNNGLDMSPLENLLNEIVDEDKIRNSEIDFGIATFSLSEKTENIILSKTLPYGKLTDTLWRVRAFRDLRRGRLTKRNL